MFGFRLQLVMGFLKHWFKIIQIYYHVFLLLVEKVKDAQTLS